MRQQVISVSLPVGQHAEEEGSPVGQHVEEEGSPGSQRAREREGEK